MNELKEIKHNLYVGIIFSGISPFRTSNHKADMRNNLNIHNYNRQEVKHFHNKTLCVDTVVQWSLMYYNNTKYSVDVPDQMQERTP